MSEILTYQPNRVILTNARDPSRTTALRNSFAREMRKRFNIVSRLITKAVDTEDVFGLLDRARTVTTMQTPGRERFAFPRDSRKVSAFMDWLDRQVRDEILDVTEINQVGEGVERAWTNKYINDSYKRGVQRARYQMRRVGFDVPSLDDTGGIEFSASTPFHIDRLGLLYTRTFNELRGITNAMDQQVSRILTQGLADGIHPRILARRLRDPVVGVPGLDISYTSARTGETVRYFMPAKRRAEILARTEIIRAHAEAQLQEFQNWGVAGVSVQAEVVTAGDNRVCPICLPQEQERYPIDVARGLIPFHPQCRCAWLPWSQEIEDKLERLRNNL